MEEEFERRKMRFPFLTVDRNFMVNVNHIVWFDWHSDQTMTICLSVPGPQGESQINIKNLQTINEFLALYTEPVPPREPDPPSSEDDMPL